MHEKSEIPPFLVGVEKACELLSIRRTHVYKLIGQGKLRSIKIGRRTLFRLDDLRDFADEAGRAVA
jgi:excisionase family DNA binding protein